LPNREGGSRKRKLEHDLKKPQERERLWGREKPINSEYMAGGKRGKGGKTPSHKTGISGCTAVPKKETTSWEEEGGRVNLVKACGGGKRALPSLFKLLEGGGWRVTYSKEGEEGVRGKNMGNFSYLYNGASGVPQRLQETRTGKKSLTPYNEATTKWGEGGRKKE